MNDSKHRQYLGEGGWHYWGFFGGKFVGPVAASSSDDTWPPSDRYTGLNDSHKVEIYERDIVRWDDATGGELWRVAEVIFEPGGFVFRTIPHLCLNCFKNDTHDFKMGSFIYCPDTSALGNVMEVIGNMHSSLDLLGVN